MYLKNTTGQKLEVFAFDYSTGAPKTGDASNITAYVNIDDAGYNALGDTSATEIDSTNKKGWYAFDLTQGETNGNKLAFTAKSSTANISVIPSPRVSFTQPATGILAPTTAGRTLAVDANGIPDTRVGSSPLVYWVKYGEQSTLRFTIRKRPGSDLAATGDWTPATGDTKLSKDGGNVANTTNNPSAVGGTGSVQWTLTLTGLETQFAEGKIQIVDQGTKAVEDLDLLILTYGHQSAKDPSDRNVLQAPRPASTIPSSVFAADTTSHAVDMPTHTEQGDLLIVSFVNDGSATVTTPSGWTLLSSDANGSAVRLSIYAKRADGTEGGTTVDFVTSATEYAAASVYKFAVGTWHGDITTGVAVGAAATGTSTSPDPPSVSPPWNQLNSLFLAVVGMDDGTNTITAHSANYTDRNDNATGNAAGVVLSVVQRSTTVQVSEDPGTFTITSQEWVSQTIAIRPAAGDVAYADVLKINGDATAASRAALFWGKSRLITVDDSTFSPTTTAFESDQTADDAARYSEQVLFALDGNNVGYTVRITGYAFTNSKVKLTVDTLPASPSNGHRFLLIGRIEQ